MAEADQAKPSPSGSLPAPRQIRIAQFVTVALLLACVLMWSRDADRCDFAAMYAAGYMVRRGEGAKLYDLAEQQRVQQAVTGRGGFLPFLNPPFTALLFFPLTGLPYRAAYVVWDTFNIGLWVGFVILMRRFIATPRNPFTYLLACFLCWPCWVVLLQAQTSLVMLLAYALTFASLHDDHEFRAGSFLGLGLLKFHLVIPFVLLCILRGKWRLGTSFAAVCLGLAAISAAVVGWSGSIAYARFLLSLCRAGSNPGFGGFEMRAMPSVAGFLSTLAAGSSGASWPQPVAEAISIILILLAAWYWRREDLREDRGAQDLAFATAVAATVMATFYLHFHDLSLLLLPLLLVIACPQWQQRTVWRWILIASAAPLYAPPLWALLVNRQWLYWLCPALMAFMVATFGVLSRQGQATAQEGTPLQLIPTGGRPAATSTGSGRDSR